MIKPLPGGYTIEPGEGCFVLGKPKQRKRPDGSVETYMDNRTYHPTLLSALKRLAHVTHLKECAGDKTLEEAIQRLERIERKFAEYSVVCTWRD